MTGPDELREAKLEKNLSALFTRETRSTRRCTKNPDASVKSPCPPCLRGEVVYFGSRFRLKCRQGGSTMQTSMRKRCQYLFLLVSAVLALPLVSVSGTIRIVQTNSAADNL